MGAHGEQRAPRVAFWGVRVVDKDLIRSGDTNCAVEEIHKLRDVQRAA
jgi:hypothetical protein